MKKEIILIYIGIAVIAIFFLNKILKRFGLLKSDKRIKREQDVQEFRDLDIFNPLFHEGKAFKPMPDSMLEELAKDVRKSVRSFGTNEELLYSTFKKLFNKINVSQLSKIYYQKYKRDMRTDIMKDLKDKEKSNLLNLIKTLPDY